MTTYTDLTSKFSTRVDLKNLASVSNGSGSITGKERVRIIHIPRYGGQCEKNKSDASIKKKKKKGKGFAVFAASSTRAFRSPTIAGSGSK